MQEHRVRVVDRNHPETGERHVHRWRAECKCGWVGVNRKDRADARRIGDQHLRIVAHAAGRGRVRRGRVEPGELTPPDQLPEILR